MATTNAYAALVKRAAANLSETYTLGYVHYDDRLTDEQIEQYVSGDTESLYESVWDAFWEQRGEYSWDEALNVLETALRSISRDYDVNDEELDDLKNEYRDSSDFDDLRLNIQERDDFDPIPQLVENTGMILMRVTNPDYEYSHDEDTADSILSDLGIPATEREKVEAALNESFDYVTPQWIFAIRLSDLKPDATSITVTSPYLWTADPFSGSGYVTDEPINMTVTIPRANLHTDSGAPGYGWDEVAGVIVSAYEASIESHVEADTE